MRHFLDIDDLQPSDLARILNLATTRNPPPVLAGKGASLLFEKPSARTRSSTEMAVVQLGGHPTYIGPAEVGLDERESVEDVTRTLACYSAVIGARVFDHRTVKRMAAVSAVPVINLLSDAAHPTQAVADLLTIRAARGHLEGRVLAYVGDANNMARSLAYAAGLSGMAVRIASPPGYEFSEADLRRMRRRGCEPVQVQKPAEAVSGADVVYTDVWTSMGQEEEAEQRRKDFAGFRVDRRLMARAAAGAVFMHCLPAHRGEEVASTVMDGPSSLVWPQAANRMHAARGLLLWLMEQV
ncbi:MAG: ornithine carbamoyltransferase [Acidimicrobiaceae bacterium]|nr:ornithine carbamoyltransferase [Acidimicrobiaceae bacterium]MDE0516655.1 ornithine carbamoyltransferase [Acidimicrobiaceae bacterium]MXZ95646.1 ornithine carbamoyltransferase [Acidimicrobiaceae bacterium]MYF42497.1 ornithine carbamoyltransferase [Acidimicrobiaceae bacterium]MYJ34969.1 ornithine carbamoyltransferase [Acidimicrobiaceae bacterium]